MRKVCIFVVMFVFGIVAGAIAGSAGGSAPAVGTVNIPNTVPKKAKTVCYDISKKRSPATTRVDVSTTTMVNWKAFTASNGTAVVMKRSFDNMTGQGYFPQSAETNLPIASTHSYINFGSYSTGGHRICVERN